MLSLEQLKEQASRLSYRRLEVKIQKTSEEIVSISSRIASTSVNDPDYVNDNLILDSLRLELTVYEDFLAAIPKTQRPPYI